VIEVDVERATLPEVAIELVDGTLGVVPRGEEDGAGTLGAVIGQEGDIGAEHVAGVAKEVLEVLPPDAKGQLCGMSAQAWATTTMHGRCRQRLEHGYRRGSST
jgi:hypothetical protein